LSSFDEGICAARKFVGVPVATPFHHVSVHVVQTESVRLLLTDWMRIFLPRVLGVLFKPRILRQVRLGVAKTVTRRRAGPAGVLPLRLGRQSEFPARQ
jgi:hypothetical protein